MRSIRNNKTVGIVPDLRNTIGGPGIFQKKLAQGLALRGIHSTYEPDSREIDALLVVNGTRKLGLLLTCRHRGIRIVQRVGLPDVRDKPMLSLYSYWQALRANTIMPIIRRFFADHIVYQSRFVEEWWTRLHGLPPATSSVIYNGVDLSLFSPGGDHYTSNCEVCILSVEGMQTHLEGSVAFLVAQALSTQGYTVELLIIGEPWGGQEEWNKKYDFIKFIGIIPHDRLPYYYRGATFYVSNDSIAACPNSAIEALACGAPVLGCNSSVLQEMLTQDAGLCVSTKTHAQDAVKCNQLDKLSEAAIQLIDDNISYRNGARNLAEERYDLEYMIDQYEKIVFN